MLAANSHIPPIQDGCLLSLSKIVWMPKKSVFMQPQQKWCLEISWTRIPQTQGLLCNLTNLISKGMQFENPAPGPVRVKGVKYHTTPTPPPHTHTHILV